MTHYSLKQTLIVLSAMIAFITLAMTATAFTANATAYHTSPRFITSQHRYSAIVSHNPPRIVVAQPTSTKRNCGAIINGSKSQPCVTPTPRATSKGATLMQAPPKFTNVIYSGDVQSELQESLPAHFTVTLECDGGYVSYSLFDMSGNNGFGLPNGLLEHRTITCDNAPHKLTYDLLESGNVAIRVDRLTTVTVEV